MIDRSLRLTVLPEHCDENEDDQEQLQLMAAKPRGGFRTPK